MGGVYTDIAQIDFDALPDQFALKATHGSQMNLICEDKSSLDIEDARKKANEWLTQDYSRACLEPHYSKIPRRIICEEFLQDTESILDYKIHCFYGKPEFILVCGNRLSGLKLKLYDTEWHEIDAVVGEEKGSFKLNRPEELSRMLEISEILSADFDFVRVDLYDIAGRIYFGELTFSPASGVLPYFSEEFLAEKGKLLNL